MFFLCGKFSFRIRDGEIMSKEITIVFDGLQVGGVERVGIDYIKIFKKLGYKVTVVNLRPKLNEMEKYIENDVKIIHFNYPRWLAPERYAQLIKENFWGKFLYPIADLSLILANCFYKFFYRIRKINKANISIAFSGHFNDLTFVEKNFVKTDYKMCWLHGALYSYLLISDGYLNLYRKIQNLVVLVDDAQEEVLAYNKGLDLRINKLYNPTFIAEKSIDSEHVAELKRKYGKFILMVSRFEYPHKDQYTVAKALEIVRNNYYEDMNLVFVGAGPDEEKVKEYVNNLGANAKKHIFFEGTRHDVQDYYKAAYLLVHASVAGEGLPTIMLEAMSYELPMVVTDSKTGPREILGESEYGLLCRVQDAEDMAQKIKKLCTEHELYREFIEKGRSRIKDFQPEVIEKQVNDILNNILSSEKL